MVKLSLTDINGTVHTSTNCLSFRFEKEYYTPYTSLNAVFVFPNTFTRITDVKFYSNEKLIHHGFVDTTDVSVVYNGSVKVKVSSKGYSFLLIQNQLEPGLKNNISLNSLMDSFISIPNVTHEDNSNTQNYIFVKDNSTMWDAVENLCFKLNSSTPYIENTNNVRITLKAVTSSMTFNNSNTISYGMMNDYDKILSDIHMQDINNAYNVYNLSNSDAYLYNIVRHKHIELDKQYLSNPDSALVFRINHSMENCFSYYAQYQGYNGEDLNDTFEITGIMPMSRINKILVTGNSTGIVTKVFAYFDKFCNIS